MGEKQLEVGDLVLVEGEVRSYDIVTDSLLLQLAQLPIDYTITVPSAAVVAGDRLGRGSMEADSEAELEAIARVAHEINRAYCRAFGDESHLRWEDSPDWQRESALDGVAFHICDRGAGPEASHERWRAQKEADGWRYGPAKDPELKTHPCMVPFHELPPEQRAKDHIFRACVHAALQLIADVDFARGLSSGSHADEEEG